MLRSNVQPLSRRLVKIGIILVAFGIAMALLLGLSVGLIFAATWVFGDPLTGIPDRLTVGLGFTAAFAFYACLIALAGGVGAGVLGLTLKVAALGAGYFRRH